MRISCVLVVLSCVLPGAAWAQNEPQHTGLSTEKVTVTAPAEIPASVLHDFIKSYTAPSSPSGKVARWRYGACPIATGLPPAGNKLVTDRVRQLAAMVGAPVGDTNCKPNIDIVFTLNPQVLMDKVREKNRVLLGYHNAAQEKTLATVTHPVQAWYTTQTVDLNGTVYIDDKLRSHGGFYMQDPLNKGSSIYIPDARVAHVTGNHLDDGVSSELYHVIIVIDLAKINGLTMGALSDYAAVLSLARTEAFETCQPVASITNLLSGSCGAELKTGEISGSDLAYLHSLYSIDPRKSFLQQKDDIAYEMRKDISRH